jgi:hypothetical protein
MSSLKNENILLTTYTIPILQKLNRPEGGAINPALCERFLPHRIPVLGMAR